MLLKSAPHELTAFNYELNWIYIVLLERRSLAEKSGYLLYNQCNQNVTIFGSILNLRFFLLPKLNFNKDKFTLRTRKHRNVTWNSFNNTLICIQELEQFFCYLRVKCVCVPIWDDKKDTCIIISVINVQYCRNMVIYYFFC